MQASFISAIFILSVPVEIYNWGTMYFYFFIAYFIGMPISAHFFLAIYYKLNITSAYEYMEMRFNRTVRTVCAVTFCLQNLLYISVVLYTPALAFSQVTGVSVLLSVIICGLVTTFYTFMGGMKATVWNDFIQMIVIGVNLVVIMVIGVLEAGGLVTVWNTNVNAGRIIFDDFRFDPTIRTTFWTQVLGGNFILFSQYASSQTTIQKFLSVKTLRGAQKAIYLTAFSTLFFLVLVCTLGLAIYAIYEGCDPLMNGQIEKPDQMVPFFVMEILGHLNGLPGLFMAAIFMAALSSISGSLNALSAVTLTDFMQPLYKSFKKVEMNERMKTLISRFLILVYGILITTLGFSAQYFGDMVVQMAYSIFGFVGGPLTSVIALGMFFPFANSWGALVGLAVSLGISSWIAVGAIVSVVSAPLIAINADFCPDRNLTDPYTTPANFLSTDLISGADDVLWIYKVSYMYYGLIAMVVCFLCGIIVSLITGKNTEVDTRLVVDWYSFLPAKMASCLQCNVTYFQREIEEERTTNEDTMKKIDSHNEINIYISEDDLKSAVKDSTYSSKDFKDSTHSSKDVKDSTYSYKDFKNENDATIESYLSGSITGVFNDGDHVNVIRNNSNKDKKKAAGDSQNENTYF